MTNVLAVYWREQKGNWKIYNTTGNETVTHLTTLLIAVLIKAGLSYPSEAKRV
jgi:hypothetical protein